MNIYKYALLWPATNRVLPRGAEVLSVQSQGDTICLWATVQMPSGLVWHVYEV